MASQNKSEEAEMQKIFAKQLRILKMSEKQFENFNRFTLLIMTTCIGEIFNKNHNIETPFHLKFQVQYSYFLEKIKDFSNNFNITEVNENEYWNKELHFLKNDILNIIPIKYPKELPKNEKFMYRNYVIFVNLCFAITDSSERAQNYFNIFFKDDIKISRIKIFIELYKALFNQLGKFKEMNAPKLHPTLEENLQNEILPFIIKRMFERYERDSLQNAFQKII